MNDSIILLDIDGVMAPANSWKAPEIAVDGFLKFSLTAQKALSHLLKQTGASIILTSTHRHSFTSLQWTSLFEKRLGHPTPITVLDEYLPAVGKVTSRFREIMAWAEGPGKDKQYVVLDDDKQLHDLPPVVKSRWIPIPSLVGLNDETVALAFRVLTTT